MRRKLVAVVLIPTIATVALAGTRIAVSVGAARDYDRVVAVAKLAGRVTSLVHALQDERDASAGFVGSGRKQGTGGGVGEARAAADSEIAAYRSAADDIDSGYSDAFTERLATVSADLDGLTDLRNAVNDNTGLTLNSITAQYAAAIDHLLDIDAAIAEQGSDNDLATSVRSLDDLSRAIEFESQNRAQLYAILTAGSFMVGQFEEYAGFAQRAQSATDQFRNNASTGDRAQYAATVRGKEVSGSNQIRDTAIQEREGQLTGNPKAWYDQQSKRLNLMRSVESQNGGGNNLVARLLAETEALSSTARRDALIASIELLGVVLLAGIGTIIIARSMTGPLRILRTSALDVADRALPEVIERLRQADTGSLDDITVTPTGIDSGDEIGEVAQAFDAVHREAVRLAVDQASLRQSVNAMFVNLSRRSQGLVERQLRLIDELESSEQNPDQLENLFKLDHLATRMRRNDDSLLVLAGSETGRGWNQPMSLPDVVLASISEVEQYTRITRTTVTEAGLVGYVVSDVVHLLAELMENATAFSPPETTVTVSSRKLSGRGGAMIEIEDHGIGMTPEELDAANARLAAPPVIDVAVVRTMGLFVVGRLANKHNIRVQLRNSPRSGVTALVLLPPSLITDLNPDSSTSDSDSGRLGSRTPYDQGPQYPPQSYEHNGMAGSGAPMSTDTGPLNLEPSPIFDSVSEWFRHRRRIDHEAMQEGPPPAYPKRGPMGAARPPAPAAPPQQQQQQRQIPPPRPPQPQQQAPQRQPQQQMPPRRAPQQPAQSPQQQRRAPQAMPERQSAPPQAAPPNGQPGGLPRRGPARRPANPVNPANSAATSTSLPRPALPQQPTPARSAQPPQQTQQSMPPMQRQPQQMHQAPQAPQMPPMQQAPEGEISWSTPADEGWKVAQATSSPSFERTTQSGLPVRTPRAHLFPGSASTAREERRTPAPKPATDRSPDSVRSLLSTYYSSYKRGRTDEADPNSAKHRANFGFPASPDEQEGL